MFNGSLNSSANNASTEDSRDKGFNDVKSDSPERGNVFNPLSIASASSDLPLELVFTDPLNIAKESAT